jgi:glycosyltransferase involved in cell wall biosynthesis
MMQKDQGGDLARMIEDAGLSQKKDVIYPINFTLANPIPFTVVNKLYNCGDIFLTTHLGEGWGLTITEAMACGVPVVSPDNTCMPEQLGKNSERGYLYPCNDLIYIDTSGYRKKGLLPDIVGKMIQAYDDGPKENNPKVKAALEYAQSLDWTKVGDKWMRLFDEAFSVRDRSKIVLTEAV